MYKSRRREEPKTTIVRDMIVVVFLIILVTLVALQFHNVMSWCGPPTIPHAYVTDLWQETSPGECKGPRFSRLANGQLDMDGCPPENSPTYIHTKMEKFIPFDQNESPQITSETVWTRCKLGLDDFQENILVQNILDEDILRKAAARAPNAATGGPNQLLSVIVILISSLSADHFTRMMKETTSYLTEIGANNRNHLFEAFPFTGYNIVAEDTLSNQIPVFSTATKETKDKSKEKWIWEQYHNLGYVTMLGEEDCVYEGSIKNQIPRVSNVNSGMIDVEFDDVYCDESMNDPRVIGKVWQHGASCIGNRYVHNVMFSYVSDFLSNYVAVPRFVTAIFQTANEPSQTRVKTMDKDLAQFLQILTTPNDDPSKFNVHPNSTNLSLIFLMSDQGENNSPFYHNTKAGFIEHKKPLLYVLAPKPWLTKYPHIRYNMMQNKEKLLTPYDVYATFEHIPLLPLHSHTPTESHANIKTRPASYSVFESIPADRSCETAEIPNAFCTCEATYSFLVLIFILPALLLFWWLYTWCARLHIKRTVYVNNLQMR